MNGQSLQCKPMEAPAAQDQTPAHPKSSAMPQSLPATHTVEQVNQMSDAERAQTIAKLQDQIDDLNKDLTNHNLTKNAIQLHQKSKNSKKVA